MQYCSEYYTGMGAVDVLGPVWLGERLYVDKMKWDF